jgi:hypothetical protein
MKKIKMFLNLFYYFNFLSYSILLYPMECVKVYKYSTYKASLLSAVLVMQNYNTFCLDYRRILTKYKLNKNCVSPNTFIEFGVICSARSLNGSRPRLFIQKHILSPYVTMSLIYQITNSTLLQYLRYRWKIYNFVYTTINMVFFLMIFYQTINLYFMQGNCLGRDMYFFMFPINFSQISKNLYRY